MSEQENIQSFHFLEYLVFWVSSQLTCSSFPRFIIKIEKKSDIFWVLEPSVQRGSESSPQSAFTCSKLTMETPEQYVKSVQSEQEHWRRSGVIIVNFEQMWRIFRCSIVDFEQVNVA